MKKLLLMITIIMMLILSIKKPALSAENEPSGLLIDSLAYYNGNWVDYAGDYVNYYNKYECYNYALGTLIGAFHPNNETLQYGDSLLSFSENVTADLSNFEYLNINVYNSSSNLLLNKDNNLICYRITTSLNGGNTARFNCDYHFMKYDYYTKKWYHKPGTKAPLMYNDSISVNNVWNDEGIAFGGILESATNLRKQNLLVEYNSSIMFTTYQGNKLTINPYSSPQTYSFTSFNYKSNTYFKTLQLNIEEDGYYDIDIISNNDIEFSMYDFILNHYIGYSENNYISEIDRLELTDEFDHSIYLSRGSYILEFIADDNQNINVQVMVNPSSVKTYTYLDSDLTNDITGELYYRTGNKLESHHYFDTNGSNKLYRITIDNVDDLTNSKLEIRDFNGILYNNMFTGNNYFNDNEFLVYLPYNSIYQFDIELNNQDIENIYLNIEELDFSSQIIDTFNLNNTNNESMNFMSYDDMTFIGNFIKKVELKQDFKFEIHVEMNVSYNNITYLIYNLDNKSLIHLEDINLNNYSSNEIFNLNKGKYLICLLNKDTEEEIYLNIKRKVTTYSLNNMITDPDEFTLCGSEINIYERDQNNKSYLGNNIHEGFTRMLYFVDGSISLSRLDYNFYSSNNVVDISIYGTVLAKPVNNNTSVRIIAICKYNPSIIYEKTLYILRDLDNSNLNILLTYTFNQNNDNTYYITFSDLDVPYPYVTLYNLSSNETFVSIYGTIIEEDTGTYEITGLYTYNMRVHLYITVNII